MIAVGFEQLPHGQGLPLPDYHSANAAGMDLHAAVDHRNPVRLLSGGRACIPTGLIIALPGGYEAQIRPRSGLARDHGITVLNAPGTIDSDYRGEIKVLLINHGEEAFEICRGIRMAQLVLAPVERLQWQAIPTTGIAGDTWRGERGFGSTGSGVRLVVPASGQGEE